MNEICNYKKMILYIILIIGVYTFDYGCFRNTRDVLITNTEESIQENIDVMIHADFSNIEHEDDVRFYYNGEYLSHWFETMHNSSAGVLWVTIPILPVGKTNGSLLYNCNEHLLKPNEGFPIIWNGTWFGLSIMECPNSWEMVNVDRKRFLSVNKNFNIKNSIVDNEHHTHIISGIAFRYGGIGDSFFYSSSHGTNLYPQFNHDHYFSTETTESNSLPRYFTTKLCKSSRFSKHNDLLVFYTSYIDDISIDRIEAYDQRYIVVSNESNLLGGSSDHHHVFSTVSERNYGLLGGLYLFPDVMKPHEHTISGNLDAISNNPSSIDISIIRSDFNNLHNDESVLFISTSMTPKGYVFSEYPEEHYLRSANIVDSITVTSNKHPTSSITISEESPGVGITNVDSGITSPELSDTHTHNLGSYTLDQNNWNLNDLDRMELVGLKKKPFTYESLVYDEVTFIQCSGIQYESMYVCSGHGECISEDNCQCEFGYSGQECSNSYTCYEILSYDVNVCSGHGQCVAEDVCECNKPHLGDECELSLTDVELFEKAQLFTVN